ncbi:hypothetical protein LLE87_30260, partial [Paenibacillus polymyxa]|nr:hypothetical protein [Paenibacillus polymyxa]
MNWLFGKTFRLVNKSWQMYLVGFLFGLGFDTATEIGVLGISAASASSASGSVAALMVCAAPTRAHAASVWSTMSTTMPRLAPASRAAIRISAPM